MTLRANPLAQERLMKPRVVTVVDAVLGLDTLKTLSRGGSAGDERRCHRDFEIGSRRLWRAR